MQNERLDPIFSNTSHVNSDNRTGRWFKKNNDIQTRWTGAHEAGHLMRFADYDDLDVSPYLGWERSIMNVRNGVVTAEDILTLLFRRGLISVEEYSEIFE